MASEVLKKALLASAKEEYLNINLVSETELWEPSESFSERMEVLMRKTKAPYRRTAKHTLLVAAVILLVSVMAVFSVATVREKVIQFFKEYYYTHFDVEYGVEEPGDIVLGDGINIAYTFSVLPDGYKQVSVTENEHSVITVWEDANENAVVLSQGDGMTKRSIDAERLEKTETVADGIVYEIYTEDEYILILWNTAEYTFSIDHYGDLKVDYLLEMAKSLKGEEK